MEQIKEAIEKRKQIVLKYSPDFKDREYIHSSAEEISIILDKYEASCPLERTEIIEELNARFFDIMGSDFFDLLSLVAEKQRARDLATHSINRTKPFHKIKVEIHITPLVTDNLNK